MWQSVMAENRIIKLGKRTDFTCHQIEHQLGAYTNCNHGQGLAVIHPVYYRHIVSYGLSKFVRFAVNVWGIDPEDKGEEELAGLGIRALAEFIEELGLPTKLRELGTEKKQLKVIADSCRFSADSYKAMSHKEILEILEECY